MHAEPLRSLPRLRLPTPPPTFPSIASASASSSSSFYGQPASATTTAATTTTTWAFLCPRLGLHANPSSEPAEAEEGVAILTRTGRSSPSPGPHLRPRPPVLTPKDPLPTTTTLCPLGEDATLIWRPSSSCSFSLAVPNPLPPAALVFSSSPSGPPPASNPTPPSHHQLAHFNFLPATQQGGTRLTVSLPSAFDGGGRILEVEMRPSSMDPVLSPLAPVLRLGGVWNLGVGEGGGRGKVRAGWVKVKGPSAEGEVERGRQGLEELGVWAEG